MKTARYVQAERAIVRADAGSIRERWLWGLRLLHDPIAMSKGGGGLKHGVATELIAAAERAGLKLSASEVRYRLQCARTYPQAPQIAKVLGDFTAWSDLIQARFPPYPTDPDEAAADWHTDDERRHHMAQKLAEDASGQQAFSFFQDYDPGIATLADLETYAREQEIMTANFVARGAARRAYLDELIRATGGDMRVVWQRAHMLARPGVPIP